MSLLVDDRTGSRELIAPLRKMGLSVESTRLEFGDIAFEGRGERGRPVSVGVEFKLLPELVQSLRTQRLQGYQLVGMRESYDYSYLFVEGELAYTRKGLLLESKPHNPASRMHGGMTVSELLKRMFVLHLKGGIHPCLARRRVDTLQLIEALYRVWTDTNLDAHKSHLGVYQAPAIVPVSDRRRTFCSLPGISTRFSLAAERHFKSIARAVQARPEEWAQLSTSDDKGKKRRLGAKLAQGIYEYLHKEA